ncbi:geranylgeranyl pyrophosphate synthase [Microbacterium faecale]|uniref:Geranylgeranyl pyrophosphate synthase n=1 Tax=Microbacterium faecale TaxID=1804630 RepID=A0A917DIX2_9MICO|nr:polyprenyl synthetase family protein [Microbacterium faecale]GGD42317.1 geranylgeranyl pyrophosphate synthase [Microbacterium faecale]
MPSPHAIVTAISERMLTFADERLDQIRLDGDIGTDPIAELLIKRARLAITGGKRLRARFAYWGWRAVHAEYTGPHPGLIDLGASVETFQAAALVHDDIVDNSDTRRGERSAWRALEDEHHARGWAGDPEEFGRNGGILLGDLLLGWSDDLLEGALARNDDPGARRAARDTYARMRRDVILGQFLDVAEEAAWPTTPDASHADRAMRIAILKSARYSVQQPLLLGAAYAGGDVAVREALAAFGRPLGLAFQLRDDALGVFGDPSVTGKPAGDDLREGKRTLLVAYAREGMDPTTRADFDDRLGSPDLTTEEITELQHVVRSSGALARVERLIDRSATEAMDVLRRAPFANTVEEELSALVTAATRRAS